MSDQDKPYKGPSLSDLMNQTRYDFQSAAANTYDPYRQTQMEGVNLAPSAYGGLNFERYYGRNAYKQLGFNPYLDNEAYYTANTSRLTDLNEARRQWGGLFNLGFTSLWNGKTSRQEAYEYERYSNIGSSTRGGWQASATNTYLNSGYTIGLLSEIALEEIAMAGMEALTLGGATPVVIGRTAANGARLGRTSATAGRLSEKLSIVNRLKDLKNLTQAKTYWQASKNIGKAMNPLRGTTEFLMDVGKLGLKDASGKITKMGTLAKMSRGFGTFYRDLREINLALDEAQLEKGFVLNRTKSDLIREFIDKHGRHPNEVEMLDINQTAATAGANTLFQNTWLIYATNRIAFGNTFNKWMPKVVRNTSKKVAGGRVVKDLKAGKLDFIKHGGVLGYKTFVNEAKHAFKKSTLKKMPLQTAKFLGKYTRANFGEGLQEYFQEVIQDAEVNMAKDRYYGAMAGGMWYDSMFSDDYMDEYKESLNKYMSAEGMEIFGSGFTMGFFVGPFSRGSQYLTNKLSDGAKYVWDNKQYRAEKEAEKQAVDEIQRNIDKFNKMTDTQQDFLKDFINYAVRQKARQAEMDQAQEMENKKEFMDLRDESLAEQILFAESMDAFDLVLDKLKNMSKLSEDELREAFSNLSEEDAAIPLNFKESSESIIEQAERIHELSQNFDALFPPPAEYGLVDEDTETGIQQKDVKRAWQRAKTLAVLNQHSLIRTMERMDGIIKEGYGKKAPFWRKDKTPPANEITRIFNRDEIADELMLLKEEIKSLKASPKLDATGKRDLKHKEKLIERLSELSSAINVYQMATVEKAGREAEAAKIKEESNLAEGKTLNYKRGNTEWSGKIVGESTNKKGQAQWIVEREGGKTAKVLKTSSGIVTQETINVDSEKITGESIADLKGAFTDYMELIGERYDNGVDPSKLEAMFEDYLDFFDLQADFKNLSKTVSLLLNPEGHSELVGRYNAMFAYERETQAETMRAQMEAFKDAKELNELVDYLYGKKNAFIKEDDMVGLREDNIVPETFYDVDNMAPIKETSDRHKEIVDFIDRWLVETGRVEEEVVEPAPAETTVAEEMAEETTTPQPKVAVTFDTPFSEWPTELQDAAEEAFNKHNQAMDEAVAEGNKAMVNLKFKTVEDFVKSQAGKLKLKSTLDAWNGDAGIAEKVTETIKPKVEPKKPAKTAEEQEFEEQATDQLLEEIKGAAEPKEFVEIDYKLDPHAERQILTGEKTIMTLPIPASNTAAMVKALKAAGHLTTDRLALEQILDVPMKITLGDTEVVLLYRGKLSVNEMTQVSPNFMQELNLPQTPQGKYKVPYTIGEETYYAESEDQAMWLKGDGKQHVFSVTTRPVERAIIQQTETIDRFINEMKRDFKAAKTIDELDNVLASVTQKNIQREIDNEAFLTEDEIQAHYDTALQNLTESMDVSDFKVGEQYELTGKLSKFGPSVVVAVTNKGVVFESFKTKKKSQPITKQELPGVVKSKITDMNEEISKTNIEIQPAEEKLIETNKDSAEEFGKDSAKIGEILDEADKMTDEEADKDFFDNLGCD